MVAQMVVGVGDQDVEYHPPPELGRVTRSVSAALAQDIDQFQVAASLAVSGAQGCER